MQKRYKYWQVFDLKRRKIKICELFSITKLLVKYCLGRKRLRKEAFLLGDDVVGISDIVGAI